ncbi:hypothetical protein [Stenotrophomonas sp.]|uniref:hypothetical protein n=1 Tax=Stenotrophomonas sp. TaxID=69392 RepID=UPI00289E8508|nr:hypothetical protein [Stenotrophomonas sp.]
MLPGRRFSQAVVGLYALACLGGLAVLLVGTKGLFGVPADGLAAVAALMLAMPWSLFFMALGVETPGAFIALIVLAMVLNGLVLWGVTWLLRKAIASLL